jgi:hypothetical protein
MLALRNLAASSEQLIHEHLDSDQQFTALGCFWLRKLGPKAKAVHSAFERLDRCCCLLLRWAPRGRFHYCPP